MKDKSAGLNKSAINRAILYFAKQEYHAGRPKACLTDAFENGPEALVNANNPQGREYVYRCCNELKEVEMLLTIDIEVIRSVNGKECLAFGPSPAISITEKGIRYVDAMYVDKIGPSR